jgi:hypothetical protein
MLLDLPARFLYRHGRDLYMPMRVCATRYSLICHVAVALAALWLVYYALLGHGLLASSGIVQQP